MTRRLSSEQVGLFDVTDPAAAPAPASRGRSRPGVRYKRRGAADDCAPCWAAQQYAATRGLPVPRRQLARWVREEDRDPGARGHSAGAGAGAAVTPLCAAHKDEREQADRDTHGGAA